MRGSMLMLTRRSMMEIPSDLYPVGTDICDFYRFKETATQSYIGEHDGEIYKGSYWASENYAKIDPTYRYAKKYYRLYRIAYYDVDKKFISSVSFSNLIDGAELTGIPEEARFVRISMYKPKDTDMHRVGLVRIA